MQQLMQRLLSDKKARNSQKIDEVLFANYEANLTPWISAPTSDIG